MSARILPWLLSGLWFSLLPAGAQPAPALSPAPPPRRLAGINRTNTPAPEIVLKDAGLEKVLALYQDFAGRTLLRAPLSPRLSFTLSCAATNQAQTARALERALAEQGIFTVPDGDRFMIVAPKEMESALRARAVKSKSVLPGGAGQPSSSGANAAAQTESAPARGQSREVVPAGMLDFRNAELSQVLGFYADLTGRKFRQGERLPSVRQIQLRTPTPLTKAEVIYALDTVLKLRGIKVVPAEDGFITAVELPPGEW